MKLLYMFIAMSFLFLFIPPDNKINPNCYIKHQSYQKQILFIWDDIQCFLKNLQVNIKTRINNFNNQSSEILEITKQSNSLLNTQKDKNIKDNMKNQLDKIPNDLLKELEINKADLKKIPNQIEREQLLHELNN